MARRKPGYFDDDYGADDEPHGGHSRGVLDLPSVATIAAIGIGVLINSGSRSPVAPSNNGPMEADCSGSTCFDALEFEDGVITATFIDGSEYLYEMSRAEARDWFEDDSLGSYFNAVVREPTNKR